MNKILLVVILALFSCSQNHQFSKADIDKNDPPINQPVSDSGSSTADSQPVDVEIAPGEVASEQMIFTNPILAIEPTTFSVKAGGQPIKFTTRLVGRQFLPNVEYTILGNQGNQLGKIDSSGLYTQPNSVKEMTNVQITASLKSDPGITAETSGIVSPKDTLFIPCKEDDKNQTIVAGLYYLSEDTVALPVFADLNQEGTVCLDQLAIARRSSSEGFPGVSDRFEWFGLRVRTKLKVPESGLVSIAINSDDGSKVYLNNNLIIDNDGIHAPQLMSTEIELVKGVHDVVVEYFQGPRLYIALELLWQLPSQNALEIIGPQYYQHPGN